MGVWDGNPSCQGMVAIEPSGRSLFALIDCVCFGTSKEGIARERGINPEEMYHFLCKVIVFVSGPLRNEMMGINSEGRKELQWMHLLRGLRNY